MRNWSLLLAAALLAGGCLPSLDPTCKRCRSSVECGGSFRCVREVCVSSDMLNACILPVDPTDGGPQPDGGRIDTGLASGADGGRLDANGADGGQVTNPDADTLDAAAPDATSPDAAGPADSGPDPCTTPPGTPPTGFDPAPSPVTSRLTGLWGRCPNEYWAVGLMGKIVHWDGVSWTEVQSPTVNDLNSVWGSGRDDVYAVGKEDTIIHWDGTRWSVVPIQIGPGAVFYSVFGFAPNNVYIAGTGGRVLNSRGAGFTTANVKIRDMVAIWGASPSDIWAGGGEGGVNSVSAVVHYNGVAWQVRTERFSAPIFGISGSAANDVWLAPITGSLLHWDGAQITQERGAGNLNWGIWVNSASDAWVVGDQIGHWDGNQWTSVFSPGASTYAVFGTSASDVWFAGEGGSLRHGP